MDGLISSYDHRYEPDWVWLSLCASAAIAHRRSDFAGGARSGGPGPL